MPILAGAAHADRTTVLSHVGHDDNLRAARHAPSFSKDVELDLAKTAGEGNLLRGRDVLIAEEDHAVIIVGPLDRSKRLVVDGSGQIHRGSRHRAQRRWGQSRSTSVVLLLIRPRCLVPRAGAAAGSIPNTYPFSHSPRAP